MSAPTDSPTPESTTTGDLWLVAAEKRVEDGLLDYTTAIDGVIDALGTQSRLSTDLVFAKREAIAALIGSHNPATNRNHSASSAADAIMDHPDFVAAWKEEREADTALAIARLTLDLARARLESAKLSHRMALALYAVKHNLSGV